MVKTYLTVAGAVLLYGLYYPAVSFLLGTMEPVVIGAFRLTLAASFFLILVVATSS